MVSLRLITLLSGFVAAVSAVPTPIIDDSDAGLNITETGDRDLRNGELIVFGAGGRSEFTSSGLGRRAVLTLHFAV